MHLERDDFGFAILDGRVTPRALAGCKQGDNRFTVSCDLRSGERARARIDLGDGADRVEVNLIAGGRNTALEIACGAGTDTIQPDDLTSFPRVRDDDCERVQLTPELAIGSELSGVGPAGVLVKLHALDGPVTAQLEARFFGRTIARGTVTASSTRGVVRRLAPTRAGRRRDERAGFVTIVLRRPGRAPLGVQLYVPGGGAR